MKAKYYSQINVFAILVSISYIAVFIGITIALIFENTTIATISIFICGYFVWWFLINIFYFHEEYMDIIWILRLFKRKRTIQYSEINEVRYLNTRANRIPYIVFVYKGKSFKNLFLPSNSFTHSRFNKRKEILLFLHSKGIPIIINTSSQKERDAFKNITNITIWQ